MNFGKKGGFGLRPVASATRRIGYATRVQDWTRVAYPMRPVANATGQKACPKRVCFAFFSSKKKL